MKCSFMQPDAQRESSDEICCEVSTRTERVKTTRTKAEEHGWDRVVDELVTVVQNVVAARRYGSGNLEANTDAGLWGLAVLQCGESDARAGPLDADVHDSESVVSGDGH